MNKLVILIAAAGLASSSIARADKIFRVGKGGTWDCKQDPVVSIEQGNGNYTLKGSCKTVTLAGGNNTMAIESAATLNVTGAHNKVTIDAVDTINLVGSNNAVTYKAALKGDAPTVNTIGTNNTVTGGKGGGGGDKPAADKPVENDKPADTAGAQDCAKSPTAVIDEGEGKYRFVGPCTKIVIDGGDNTVAIESVKELAITGAGNTVNVGAADRISLTGNDNKLTYKKGLSGAKPKISSVGHNNTVTQAK